MVGWLVELYIKWKNMNNMNNKQFRIVCFSKQAETLKSKANNTEDLGAQIINLLSLIDLRYQRS